MKRNNLQWAVPMAALCLLAAACSKDDPPVDTSTRSITVSTQLNPFLTTTVTTGPRMSLAPNNTDPTVENCIWHKGDSFQGWLIPAGIDDYNYDSHPVAFDIDGAYDDGAPSATASFSCPDFPNKKAFYKMLVISPKEAFDPATNVVTFENQQIQTGRNSSRHLARYMTMRAITTIDSGVPAPRLPFIHLTSLLRFTVKNTNASALRITGIGLKTDSKNGICGASIDMPVSDWRKGVFMPRIMEAYKELALTLKESADSEKGIELSARDAADNANVFDAYATAGYNAYLKLNEQKFVFTISVTDADGSNPRTFTSPEFDGSRITKTHEADAPFWINNRCYSFDLVLSDHLAVAFRQVTPIPGWDDETNL